MLYRVHDNNTSQFKDQCGGLEARDQIDKGQTLIDRDGPNLGGQAHVLGSAALRAKSDVFAATKHIQGASEASTANHETRPKIAALAMQACTSSHNVNPSNLLKSPTSMVRPTWIGSALNHMTLPLSHEGAGFGLDPFGPGQCTPWAGEWPFTFPGDPSVPSTSLQGNYAGAEALFPGRYHTEPSTATEVASIPLADEHMTGFPGSGSSAQVDLADYQPQIEATSAASSDNNGQVQGERHMSTQILFQEIAQPPAAVLIGGMTRWRRLQRYFYRIIKQSRAVKSAFSCVVELLAINDTCGPAEHDRNNYLRRIFDLHEAACHEIQSKLLKPGSIKARTREHLLAAIFLLAWFEVIHDQDTTRSLFPRDLADAVITGYTRWSRYSQELLSWLNTLDSKAVHMGGENLLSQKSLEIVSHYPTQIASATVLENGDEACQGGSGNSDSGQSECSPGSVVSMEQSGSDLFSNGTTALTIGQVKQAMLNATLQPALEWYLTSQSYCRRISAQDKHHRRRTTTDDEYEVINACKQLESELFELWACRPFVISLTATQLAQVVSHDVATRLEEIFSVYLASFWILFVHLHRVSWWNFPLSDTARRALSKVWNNMQRAYGEFNEQTKTKTVHPALLWPLFMFGCESKDFSQRAWVIEQLEALGEAKPIVTDDEPNVDTLPPFKLSSGATRNAKRASVLLRELVKQQDQQGVRVDDRDLSTTMFNCYFSIV